MRIFFFLALVLWLGAGCTQHSPSDKAEHDRDAIVKVRAENRQAVTNATVELRNGRKVFNSRKYFALLKQIDTSDCPTDFRIAWSDYTFAWGETLNAKGAGDGLVEIGAAFFLTDGLGAALASDGLHSASAGKDESDQAKKRLREALHECEVAEIRYDAR